MSRAERDEQLAVSGAKPDEQLAVSGAGPGDGATDGPGPPEAVPGEQLAPGGDWVRVTNEFTSAQVRLVHTRNGERLEVVSRRLGTRVLLDPLELESLTWQTPATFSRLLEHPFGPEEVATAPLSALLDDRAEVRSGSGDAAGGGATAEGSARGSAPDA